MFMFYEETNQKLKFKLNTINKRTTEIMVTDTVNASNKMKQSQNIQYSVQLEKCTHYKLQDVQTQS